MIAQISNTELSYGWLLLKTIGALAFILFLAILFIKYILPRLTYQASKKGSAIKVIEKFPLEARKSLWIVEVESKRLLLASSEQGLTKIDEL